VRPPPQPGRRGGPPRRTGAACGPPAPRWPPAERGAGPWRAPPGWPPPARPEAAGAALRQGSSPRCPSSAASSLPGRATSVPSLKSPRPCRANRSSSGHLPRPSLGPKSGALPSPLGEPGPPPPSSPHREMSTSSESARDTFLLTPALRVPPCHCPRGGPSAEPTRATGFHWAGQALAAWLCARSRESATAAQAAKLVPASVRAF